MGLAELRAMRAYYYWQICDNFGDAPLVTTTTMELPSKSNRKEIFDFIVKELKEIIPSLSEEQGGNFYGRMNKWAAKTLLAKHIPECQGIYRRRTLGRLYPTV